jgi:hypothetical protein
MIASEPRQVQHFGPTRLGRSRRRPPEQLTPPAFADQRKHEIAPGIDVVDRHEQLAKPGLPEVVRQQLHVSTAEVGYRRLPERRGTPKKIP